MHSKLRFRAWSPTPCSVPQQAPCETSDQMSAKQLSYHPIQNQKSTRVARHETQNLVIGRSAEPHCPSSLITYHRRRSETCCLVNGTCPLYDCLHIVSRAELGIYLAAKTESSEQSSSWWSWRCVSVQSLVSCITQVRTAWSLDP